MVGELFRDCGREVEVGKLFRTLELVGVKNVCLLGSRMTWIVSKVTGTSWEFVCFGTVMSVYICFMVI